MLYKSLGKSALNISRIAFGCMSLTEKQDVSTSLILRAIELGVNFFDTADMYQKGMNEEMVGKALQGKRKDIFLASKVGNQWRADGSGWDWNPRKEYIIEAVEKSLDRLRTDYLDLYQLHGGTIDDPIDESIEAFEILVQQGKIRYYGISSIRPNVIREYVKRSNIVSVMMQYSLLDRRAEEECLALLLEHEIGVLARGSLAKGLLAGKAPATFSEYTEAQVAKAADGIRNVSNANRTSAQSAIQFVLGNPAVTSAVTGIRTIEQLEDVANLGNALSKDEFDELKNMLPAGKYDVHR